MHFKPSFSKATLPAPIPAHKSINENSIVGLYNVYIKSKKYKDDLVYDYLRIPFTKNESVFNELSKLGERLIDLHLLKMPSKTNYGYPVEGEHSVLKPKLENNRLYINDTQYFDNVSNEVFTYSIGGYEVIPKYLKSREVLGSDDILHIQKIISVIAETILIKNDIDTILPTE